MGQEPTPTVAPEAPATPAAEPGAPPAEPTPTPEPKQFDEGYVKQLRDEAAKWRTEAQAAKTKVQEFEDQSKTETERLADQAKREGETRQQVERERDDLQSRIARYEIAAKVGLDLDFAARLQGQTAEELEQDAKRLKERLGAGPAPSWDGGSRGGPAPALPEDASPLQRLASAYGTKQ